MKGQPRQDGRTALAGYFENLKNGLEDGRTTRPEAWHQVLKDHPYVSEQEIREILRDEYCIECGTSISHLPEGSELCKECFYSPRQREHETLLERLKKRLAI